MKKFLWILGVVSGIQMTFAEETVFIYLIDPSDKQAQTEFKPDVVDDAGTIDLPTLTPTLIKTNMQTTATNTIALPSTPTTDKPKRSIDDIIEDFSKKPPFTKAQERILKKVTADQIEFMHLMDGFLEVEFDASDDQAKTAFNRIRDRIVSLVFDAPSEKYFYERLFLINKSYLEHTKELPRFNSLSHALRDRSLVIEERSRRYRQIITGVAALGGAAAGGFLSFKAAQRILPIVATEGGFSQIIRWAGRSTIVFIGAGVGAIAGAELGFLGSEYLFRRRDFVSPVDGDEDLRDILLVIDSLP
jgi:hypothetical protein